MSWSDGLTQLQIEELKSNREAYLWCPKWKQEAFKAMGKENRGYMFDQGYFLDDELNQVLPGCTYRLKSTWKNNVYEYLLGD